MDIKAKAEEIIAQLKKDPRLLASFKENPVAAIEKLTGLDLPDDQLKSIADLVKAKLDLDKAGEVLGALGGLFKK